MKDDLVSIVVPIYNVEKYLKQCIESLINQTYKNIEIILVNDGSQDNCSSICNNYAYNDKRIKLINKENGGLSSARNAGIDIAKGKYICFVDGDDFVNEEYIQIMYNKIKKNKADIVICNYQRVVDIKDINKNGNSEKEWILSGKEECKNIYNKSKYVYTIVAWNKLYKMEMWKNIKFPVGKVHEDEFITYKLLYNSNRVINLEKKLYYYRIVPNSIMNKKINETKLNALEALEERINFFKEKEDIELKNLTVLRLECTSLRIAFKYKMANMNELSDYCYDVFKKYYKVAKKIKKISFIQRSQLFMAFYFKKIYFKLYKLLKWSR